MTDKICFHSFGKKDAFFKEDRAQKSGTIRKEYGIHMQFPLLKKKEKNKADSKTDTDMKTRKGDKHSCRR